MKKEDKIKVMVVSGNSREFDVGHKYDAEIMELGANGDHSIMVTNKFNEQRRATMFNTSCLNGGSFKQVLECIK